MPIPTLMEEVTNSKISNKPKEANSSMKSPNIRSFTNQLPEESDVPNIFQTPPRSVYLLREDLNSVHNFSKNIQKTAHFSLWTFFPLSLFFQFRRVSNCFFLSVCIISLIPGVTPIVPYAVIFPFLIVLFSGILKSGWEDFKRHREDKRANGVECCVLRGETWTMIKSYDIKVGDVMLYKHNEQIQADSILLNSSLPDGIAYINTANLDGESNAKAVQALPEVTSRFKSVEHIINYCVPPVLKDEFISNKGVTLKKVSRWKYFYPCSNSKDEPKELFRDMGDEALKPIPKDITQFQYDNEISCADMKCTRHSSTPHQSLPNLTLVISDASNHSLELNKRLLDSEKQAELNLNFVTSPSIPSINLKSLNSTDINRSTMFPYKKLPEILVTHSSFSFKDAQYGNSPQPFPNESSAHESKASVSRLQHRHLRSWSYSNVHIPNGAPFTYRFYRSGPLVAPRCNSFTHILPRLQSDYYKNPELIRKNDISYSNPTNADVNGVATNNLTLSKVSPLLCHRRAFTYGNLHDASPLLNRSYKEISFKYDTNSGFQKNAFHKDMSQIPGTAEQKKPDRINANLVNIDTHESSIAQCSEDGDESSKSWKNFGVRCLASNPDKDLTTWYGQLSFLSLEKPELLISMGLEQFLPRGVVMRNCEWILCAAIYTGKDTKVELNLSKKREKMSVMTSRMNKLNIILLIIGQIINFIFCGLAVWWNNRTCLPVEGGGFGDVKCRNHWYISYFLSDKRGIDLFGWIYLTNFIILSNLIPLSLYFTLEFVEALQMIQISNDPKLSWKNPNTGEICSAKVHTSSLHPELAFVRYIFTDKTGTLTENNMQYIAGSIVYEKPSIHSIREKGKGELEKCTFYHDERNSKGGLGKHINFIAKSLYADMSLEIPATKAFQLMNKPTERTSDGGNPTRNDSSLPSSYYSEGYMCYINLLIMALCNTCATFDKPTHLHSVHPNNSSKLADNVSSSSMTSPDKMPRTPHGVADSLFPLNAKIEETLDNEKINEESSFFLSPYPTKNFESQSLDEVALVKAANDNGISLHHRTTKNLFVIVFGKMQCFDIIAELPFTAQRKMMSIIIQRNRSKDQMCPCHVCDPMSTESKTFPQSLVDLSLAESVFSESSVPFQIELDQNSPQVRNSLSLQQERKGQNLLSSKSRQSKHFSDKKLTSSHQSLKKRRIPISNTLVPQKTFLKDSYGMNESLLYNSPIFVDCSNANNISSPGLTSNISKPSLIMHEEGSNRCDKGKKESQTLCTSDSLSNLYASVEPPDLPLLLLKGADCSMFEVMDKEDPFNIAVKTQLDEIIEDESSKGNRCLVLGFRIMEHDKLVKWLCIFNSAQANVVNRDILLADAYSAIEHSFIACGITVVEDLLQPSVPNTLQFLRAAGILVWMITGDTCKTALTIGVKANLFDPQRSQLIHLSIAEITANKPPTSENDTVAKKNPLQESVSSISADNPLTNLPFPESEDTLNSPETLYYDGIYDVLTKAKMLIENREINVVLVIDGVTLNEIFKSPELTDYFYLVSSQCHSAICCRMTPIQKALIVWLFQNRSKKVCLAIGDGSNDVSMLLQSRVGVGICGLEGSQAEMSSDYAISHFGLLVRLLAVHGRRCFYGQSICILYSLYKNITMMTLLLLYNFYCGFSGQTFFDSWLIGLVNVFFSFVQPLLLGVFDSDINDEMVETNPKLYLPLGREWMFFNWKVITKEVILSIVEGTGLFFTIYILMLSMDLFSVYSGGLIDYGTVAFFCFIILIDLRVMAYAETFNRIIFLGLLFTWLMIPLFLFLYSALPDLLGVNYMVNVIPQLFRTSMFYQYIYLTVVIFFFILHLLINELIETFIPFRNSRTAMKTAYEIDNDTEFYSSAPASPEDSPISLKTA